MLRVAVCGASGRSRPGDREEIGHDHGRLQLHERHERRPAARPHHRRPVRPHRRPVSRQRGARLPPPGPALHLPPAPGRGRPLRPGTDRARRREGPARRDLGAELRGVDDHPVRDGQAGRDPREHQPELPAQRGAVRAQAVRLHVAGDRAAVQDLGLHGDDPRADARAGRRAGPARWPPPPFPNLRGVVRLGEEPSPGMLALGRAAGHGRAGRRRRAGAAAAAAGIRRSDQHPVHQRDHRLSQGRHAQPPQHPQQRLLHHRAAALHRPGPAADPGAALPLLRHGDGQPGLRDPRRHHDLSQRRLRPDGRAGGRAGRARHRALRRADHVHRRAEPSRLRALRPVRRCARGSWPARRARSR